MHVATRRTGGREEEALAEAGHPGQVRLAMHLPPPHLDGPQLQGFHLILHTEEQQAHCQSSHYSTALVVDRFLTATTDTDDTALRFATSRLIITAAVTRLVPSPPLLPRVDQEAHSDTCSVPDSCELPPTWGKTPMFPSLGRCACPKARGRTSGWSRPSSANTCQRPR